MVIKQRAMGRMPIRGGQQEIDNKRRAPRQRINWAKSKTAEGNKQRRSRYGLKGLWKIRGQEDGGK